MTPRNTLGSNARIVNRYLVTAVNTRTGEIREACLAAINESHAITKFFMRTTNKDFGCDIVRITEEPRLPAQEAAVA